MYRYILHRSLDLKKKKNRFRNAVSYSQLYVELNNGKTVYWVIGLECSAS